MKPASVVAEVRWENEMLDQNDTETRQKCELVSKCEYETKETVVVEEVPSRNCTPVTESKEVCGRVPVTKYRVVEDVQYEVRYVSECQVVSQPSCSTSPCQSNGCSNGGTVCSQTEYSPQTVCAQGPSSGSSSDCQQVEMPVCYGNLGSCGYDQQCCSNSAREVCRQIPRRFPVRRNITVPDVTWEEKCETKERTRQDCVDTVETRNRTRTEQICNELEVESCHNYTVPNYKVVSKNYKYLCPCCFTPALFLTRNWRRRRRTCPSSLVVVTSGTSQRNTATLSPCRTSPAPTSPRSGSSSSTEWSAGNRSRSSSV